MQPQDDSVQHAEQPDGALWAKMLADVPPHTPPVSPAPDSPGAPKPSDSDGAASLTRDAELRLLKHILHHLQSRGESDPEPLLQQILNAVQTSNAAPPPSPVFDPAKIDALLGAVRDRPPVDAQELVTRVVDAMDARQHAFRAELVGVLDELQKGLTALRNEVSLTRRRQDQMRDQLVAALEAVNKNQNGQEIAKLIAELRQVAESLRQAQRSTPAKPGTDQAAVAPAPARPRQVPQSGGPDVFQSMPAIAAFVRKQE